MMEIKTIKKYFPWFKNNRGWVYLDSAATSLKPETVVKYEEYYYFNLGTNTHNTDSKIAQKVNDIVDDTRKKTAKLLSCTKDEISFSSGATESLNLFANGLLSLINKSDEIILPYSEHASNLLPWINLANIRKCKLVYIGNQKEIISENDFLKRINKNTKVIAFANVSNLFGNHIKIEELTKKIKRINKNIIIVLDGTQSIPHEVINLQKADIDFLAFSAHKMLGPTGLGISYINKRWTNKISPLRLGGGMNSVITKSSFKCADNYERYEGGTPNIAGIFGFNKAIDFINQIGFKEIVKYERELKSYLISKIKNIKNIIILHENENSPVLSFNIKNIYPQDLANYLASKKIIVRSGVSCAKLQKHITNVEQGFVRVSIYFYNDKHDIDILINALKKFKKGDILRNVV